MPFHHYSLCACIYVSCMIDLTALIGVPVMADPDKSRSVLTCTSADAQQSIQYAQAIRSEMNIRKRLTCSPFRQMQSVASVALFTVAKQLVLYR